MLDIHDGEILPTLENRRMITRLIRQWNADIVIANRPNDYHPDHRYTSILVQDSAYMVTVPFFCPDVPALKKNPVFLYASDRFERPNPFRPDVAVVDRRRDGADAGCAACDGVADPRGRRQRIRRNLSRRRSRKAAAREEVRTEPASATRARPTTYRDALVKFYGEDRGRRFIRAGVRGLRVRPSTVARRVEEAVSFLKAATRFW